MHNSIRRTYWILGTAGLITIPLVTMGTSAAEAEEGPLSGLHLPVASSDVTNSDRDLKSVDREVVVFWTTEDGPVVVKLRAKSHSKALELAHALDSQPGVYAGLNAAFSIPAEPVENRSGKAEGPKLSATSVPALADEEYARRQWGMAAVGAEDAWGVTRGEGVTVAVIDTGVDASHHDLQATTRPQIDLVDDGYSGDPDGHGTHVAGIIAAALDGAGVAGLANGVSILPVRVLDYNGSGDAATVAEGIVRAVDAGAAVINISLGSPYYSSAIAAAVEYALSQGVTVVASGGNSYEEGNPREYPAALPGVLGVSSMNSDFDSSSFANTGSYIDITAPGEGILSTAPGGGYVYKSGTSMAAPFVSAAAALARAANPTYTNGQVERVIYATAIDDSSGNGPDDIFGYGILQAGAVALAAGTDPGGIKVPSAPSSPRDLGTSIAAGTVKFNWAPPASDGGAPVEEYVVEVGSRSWTTSGTSLTVSGLPGGTYSTVSVSARNSAGTSVAAALRFWIPATAKISAKSVSGGGKLLVDINPDGRSGHWQFRVQAKKTDGSWAYRPGTYATQGSSETRTLDLPRGTYRVIVLPKYGYLGSYSSSVWLSR